MISECINHTHTHLKYHTIIRGLFHKPVCSYQPVASNLAEWSALQHVMRRLAQQRRPYPPTAALFGALQAIGRTTKGRATGGGAVALYVAVSSGSVA